MTEPVEPQPDPAAVPDVEPQPEATPDVAVEGEDRRAVQGREALEQRREGLIG